MDDGVDQSPNLNSRNNNMYFQRYNPEEYDHYDKAAKNKPNRKK